MNFRRTYFRSARSTLHIVIGLVVITHAGTLHADYASPSLSRIFPMGGQRGTAFEIELSGAALDGCEEIRISTKGISFRHIEGLRFEVSIGTDVPVGAYDVQAVGPAGISSTRCFYVSGQQQYVEMDPAETGGLVTEVSLGMVSSGCIGGAGDVDPYSFNAAAGQQVVIECWSERLDSALRGTLELYDPAGKRIAVNRGFFGSDPLIAHLVTMPGRYTVKVADLVFSGGAGHFYRLDIHTGPRVLYTIPTVVQLGQSTRVDFHGWNLGAKKSPAGGCEVVSREILATEAERRIPIYRPSSTTAVEGFAYRFPGVDVPEWIQTTTAAVVAAGPTNRSLAGAMEIAIPSDVSGDFGDSNQPAWFAVNLRRGEVIHLEAYAARVGSPLDLTMNILSPDGGTVLAVFEDEVRNLGGQRFPTTHSDPSGRWTAPGDGRYVIVLRDVIGGPRASQRRSYRLSLRRETTPFTVVAVGRRSGPSSTVVRRGGRELIDLVAIRRLGFEGNIHVRARGLPDGLECPDVWFGPGVTRVPLVVSAADSMADTYGHLEVLAETTNSGVVVSRQVQGGSMVRTGTPNGIGRLTSDIPWSTAGESVVRLTSVIQHARTCQGSVIEMQVLVDRADNQPSSAVRLTGSGLPPMVQNRLGEISAGNTSDYISFYLPPTLPPGTYSIAVQGTTKVAVPDAADREKTKELDVTVTSNTQTFVVYPAPYIVNVNLDAPTKIKRGEVIQLHYTAVRKNGFIGKIHTELAAPGGVRGIRGRGVTFVGQTESGVIQIIANEDAPLGQQRGLRIEGLGTVEDEPIHLGGCFLNLEIVE